MDKGAALANVIDLETFRQRKRSLERVGEAPRTAALEPMAWLVPVWVCWVPLWYGP